MGNMRLNVVGQDSSIYMRRKELNTICFGCDRRLDGKSCCAEIGNGTPVHHPDYQKGLPFCPIGLHDPETIRKSGKIKEIETKRSGGWRNYTVAITKVALALFGGMLSPGCITPTDIRQARSAACNGCKYRKKRFWLFDKCGKCGCFLRAKVRIGTEACPAGFWRALAQQCMVLDTLKFWKIDTSRKWVVRILDLSGCSSCGADKETKEGMNGSKQITTN